MYAFKLKFNSNPRSDKGFEIEVLLSIYIGSLHGKSDRHNIIPSSHNYYLVISVPAA